MLSGDLSSALQDYSSVLGIDPDHLDALVHRGTVNEKLGNLDAAIADFTKVLELEPNHVKAAYARGACRNLKGDFADAIGGSLLETLKLRRPRSLAACASGQRHKDSHNVKSSMLDHSNML